MARRFLSVSTARRATFQLLLLIVKSAAASATAGAAIIVSVCEALGEAFCAGAAAGLDSAFASGFTSVVFLSSLDSGAEAMVAEAMVAEAMAPGSLAGVFAASGECSVLAETSFLALAPETSGVDSAAIAPVGFDST